MNLTVPASEPWLEPARYWPALTAATEALDTPFGIISAGALAWNAHDMLRRSNGTTIRVASKSVRVRGVIDAVLSIPGYHGVLAYTLAEGLWLAETIDDVVIGYPTVDRASIAALGQSSILAQRVTIMIDTIEQLDLVDAVLPPGQRENIRVCLELDAAWASRVLGHVGVFRSPVRTVEQAIDLARAIVARAGFTLVGMMAYESQIAGVINRPRGKPMLGHTVDWMQKNSRDELSERRGQVVLALRDLTELEFVNGGGTGSLESTASDPAVTEIAAGSGLFGPHLFDGYGHFQPAPAAAFALSVVRKPTPEMATLLGGGWIASGPPAADRLPRAVWPEGLGFVAREMAGEVQTPLTGAAALAVGDRVWMRHTKAGEVSEHLTEFAIVDEGRVTEMMPTYRGEGKAFL
ncbi:alanine racemase [Salinibacterium sp.]|uniref:alanine racemase n=1 Tax=Salinibacterium sp. TaxID=1915057 RepID=UPI00286B5C3E|nr:alanine racemase [Salinibacterium sp.]